MMLLHLAGLRIGIDNQYDFSPRVREWMGYGKPQFVVRVSEVELEREDGGRGLPKEYLEFICVYRQIAEHLPDYDAFVFHGGAVAKDGLAYLFTAPSGTGKTTHLIGWKIQYGWEAWFLNGDKPILRKSSGGFVVCGTPWRGKEELGVNAILPIQGICMLHRGEENRISRAKPEEMIRFLSRQVYFPKDPARMEKMLSLLDECCRTVPVWDLYCTVGRHAAECAYEAMKPHPCAAAVELPG